MEKISVETKVNQPLQKVWDCFTNPTHMTQWNFASDDWCCPTASNDLRPGGKLTSRIEKKDGSIGFDFMGTYIAVEIQELLEYMLEDGRTVSVTFKEENGVVEIIETFEPESDNDPEFQKWGWQTILSNFKKYVESIS
ncbi:MAG: SRPBCC domain-containing protein [Cyclobacteriaceae bacterium]